MRRTNWLLVLSFVLTVCGGHAAAQSAGWTMPDGGGAEKSPLKTTPEVLKKGRGIFMSKCQKCHGPQGTGDGPDSNPDEPAGDLTDAARAPVNPEGVMFYKVWNGRTRPKMPAFKSELTKDEVWTVVEYVKSLRK